jgi:Flp pilus assembly protein TadG
MSKIRKPTFKSTIKDQRGQVLPWMAMTMALLIGMTGFAIDVGHAMLVHTQLQNSSDAAALAGAETLPATTAQSTAVAYSSMAGDKNVSGVYGTTTTTVTVACLNSLVKQYIQCPPPANANAVRVTQSVAVPMYFLRVFGIGTMTVRTTATAASKGAVSTPHNIAVILDTTLSMYYQDNDCGNTQIGCALNGFQTLMKYMYPCGPNASWSCGSTTNGFDRVALVSFPNVSVGTVGIDTNCTTLIPAYYQSPGWSPSPNINGYYYTMLPTTLIPWSGTPTALPYSFPVRGAQSYNPLLITSPTYQISQFSSDYQSKSTGAAPFSLNTQSNLVQAAGGDPGCGAMAPSNYDGDYGTYYAGALYAAQSALTAEQSTNPGSTNVIILLSDGDATAPNAANSPDPLSPSMGGLATSNGLYPSWNGMCGQGVVAAQYAASQGTVVYTIAYGSPLSGCASDQSPGPSSYIGISPCTAMSDMAQPSNNFYSDYNNTAGSSGCLSTAHPNTLDLTSIFATIGMDLTAARLIPAGTT